MILSKLFLVSVTKKLDQLMVSGSIFCSGFSLPESGKVSKTRLTGLVVFSYRIFMTGSLSSTIASSPSCHCQAAIPSPSRPSPILLFP